MGVYVRRVYDDRGAWRGRCFLVDRMWPRGLSRKDLDDVVWLKDLAPSSELRHWFGHDPQRWPEFARRYRAELARASEAFQPLLGAASEGDVTLLYAAKDTTYNNAVVLADVLDQQLGSGAKEQRD